MQIQRLCTGMGCWSDRRTRCSTGSITDRQRLRANTPPNRALHLTGAAIPIFRDTTLLQAAPAGELLVRPRRNPVVKSISLGATSLAAFLVFADSAGAADARMKVALLDGAPVYHWRVFKSRYSDDIDRALVLREFK